MVNFFSSMNYRSDLIGIFDGESQIWLILPAGLTLDPVKHFSGQNCTIIVFQFQTQNIVI